MSQIPHTSPFDGIRHEDELGKEYWSARELYKMLGYSTWQRFQNAIEQAKIACEQSGQAIEDHFTLMLKSQRQAQQRSLARIIAFPALLVIL